MYFKVVGEKSSKETKPFFNIGQRINDSDLKKVRKQMSPYHSTDYDSFYTLKIVWLGKDVFESDYFVHSISLEKVLGT